MKSVMICTAAVLALSLGATLSSLGCRAAEEPKKPAKPITLYGEVNDLSILCSSGGLKLSRNALPAKVDKISLGSAAAYSGVRDGDNILKAEVSDELLTLTIERKGRTYQAKIATDVKGLRAEFENKNIKWSIGDSPFDKQLKSLANCDITIMLDRCATMADNHAGCPGDLSKWIWCKQQIDNLYLTTNRVLDNGFRLVLFNNTFVVRNDVTLWDLKEFFARTKPEGTQKNISAPLESVLTDYFKYRKPNSKPCLIIVLTEGTRNSGTPLQDVLIEVSQKMNRQGEVMVVMMQVGESLHAEELFDDLDRNLTAKGAKFPMVRYKPFSQLRNKGLVWEVVSSVAETTQPPAAKK
jgi:hypothetical protein